MKVGRGIPMLCIRSIVHYINIYSRIVIQLNMYVKIITSSGFKSTILTDFVQGQFRVPFRFGRCLPEVHLFTGSCRLLRRLFNYARGSTQMENKKNKKKIGAEFMTSVSYRPEVIIYQLMLGLKYTKKNQYRHCLSPRSYLFRFFILLFVCRYIATGMAEGFNGNSIKDVSSAKTFRLGLA